MRLFPSLLIVAVIIALAPPAGAVYPDPDDARFVASGCGPQYQKRFVFDYVGLLRDEWAEAIEGGACEVYANTSAHFVLVLVPDTQGEILENYAFHLFETWGVGDKERLDGLMLLFVLDHEGASAVRVEVGYGLEGVVSGRVAADAVDAMAAARDDALDAGWSREEALEFALLTGSGFLLDTLDASYVDGRFPEPDPYAEGPPASFVLLVVVLVFVLVALLASTVEAHGRRSGWGYRSSRSSWESGLGGAFAGALIRGALGGGPRRPGGGFGGGGFGGGGSFGGGRSGGGGGSGRL